ncbi:MAG: hypothetical protein AB7G06_01690 [Bdellovibrionales bacterium]
MEKIEFVILTPRLQQDNPWPHGDEYHFPLMPMKDAYALEMALCDSGHFSFIGPAVHPTARYTRRNPNRQKYARDGRRGVVGFRMEVAATEDIREAYDLVLDIVEETLGKDHGLMISEASVSRGGVAAQRQNPYYYKDAMKARDARRSQHPASGAIPKHRARRTPT